MQERALDAVAADAQYADVRAVTEDREHLSVQDQQVEGVERRHDAGLGIRVLVDGAWGFAGTGRLHPADVDATAARALAVARASASARRTPIELAPVAAHQATWQTPYRRDPLEVGVEEKLELLLAATAAAGRVAGLAFARASADAWRTHKRFRSTEGADLTQTILHVGGGVECFALSESVLQRRSYPNSFRGHCGSGGWEQITALDLEGQAVPHAEEAVALLDAPVLPEQTGTLVLGGSQLALQVHESCGHATELDRVLGSEAAFAGTSFLSVPERGWLRYGSPAVSITVDTTTPGALGTYGFDDEGVEAGRHPLVVEGVLQGFLTSRETAGVLGPDVRSNGTMRADGWGRIPLIRMSNIHLEPGTGTLEELLADTGDGVYMTTNRSWSIDDRRLDFAFGCEVAYEIKDGRLGRRFRDPGYAGRTPTFWGSCDAVTGPGEWQVHGTPNCGKGEPMQVARVAHGAAPARFRDVAMGRG